MTNEVQTVAKDLAQPLIIVIKDLLILHGGGVVVSMLFTAALHLVLDIVFNKKSNGLLLTLSMLVGVVYRGYTTEWINHITLNQNLAVSIVGIGYGLLAFLGYYLVLIPVAKIVATLVKNKFGINLSAKEIFDKHVRRKRK